MKKCTICSTTENVQKFKHLPYPKGRSGHVTLSDWTEYCVSCAKQQGEMYAEQMDRLIKSRQ